jgi:hypothetical protein
MLHLCDCVYDLALVQALGGERRIYLLHRLLGDRQDGRAVQIPVEEDRVRLDLGQERSLVFENALDENATRPKPPHGGLNLSQRRHIMSTVDWRVWHVFQTLEFGGTLDLDVLIGRRELGAFGHLTSS